GPSMATLVPLADGSFLFSTSAIGVITGGTGRYDGASGIKSSVGSGRLTAGTQLTAGTTFRAYFLDVFRVVKSEDAVQPASPAHGAAATRPNNPVTSPPASALPPGENLETYRIGPVNCLLR